ncbi:MAG: M23 family metallopeptidase [Deltaproteobacteria bacterium]|nr:M23 family metallopeptidase [Deltaproteobacteria bacterium]
METWSRPSIFEALGLFPLKERAQQALLVLRGAEDVPPSRFDYTSLAMLRPRLALPLWLGRFPIPKKIIITNLYNHRQTPVEDGWSVRRTQVKDFRGGELTYDSHNGTDFSIPVGTLLVAPAPCRVARVYAEYNRGGHKVVLDHGDGLITCSAHLARPCVEEGQLLRAGDPYAISGYSGIDALTTFPWGTPHVHFNVWLNGEPVDPFAFGDQRSLWIGGEPQFCPPTTMLSERPAAEFDAQRIETILATCKTASTRQWLRSISDIATRGAYLVCEQNYYPTRFPRRGNVYKQITARGPRLFLPFRSSDFDGVVFADQL